MKRKIETLEIKQLFCCFLRFFCFFFFADSWVVVSVAAAADFFIFFVLLVGATGVKSLSLKTLSSFQSGGKTGRLLVVVWLLGSVIRNNSLPVVTASSIRLKNILTLRLIFDSRVAHTHAKAKCQQALCHDVRLRSLLLQPHLFVGGGKISRARETRTWAARDTKCVGMRSVTLKWAI